MAGVYRDLIGPEDAIDLRPGDRLFVEASGFSLAGLTDPSGTADRSFAELAADDVEADLAARGIASLVSVVKSGFRDATTLYFKLEVWIIGFDDPKQEVALAATPFAWAAIAVLAVFAGTALTIAVRWEPAEFTAAAEAAALWPIAAVVVAGFLLLYAFRK